MVSNILMKKPALTMGILMMGLFLYGLFSKGEGLFLREALMAKSCRAVIVKLGKRVPSTWKLDCQKQNLSIEVLWAEKLEVGDEERSLYRELANILVFTAKNSPEETLERVPYVQVKLKYQDTELNALSEGKFVIKLATLEDQNFIAQHLQATVSTQMRKLKSK